MAVLLYWYIQMKKNYTAINNDSININGGKHIYNILVRIQLYNKGYVCMKKELGETPKSYYEVFQGSE